MRIPLFPLGTVLFPGGFLPLQIFEVRYLDMVQRCHREGSPFGVVTLQQGHEVQQRDPQGGEGFVRESFLPVGTLARITALQAPQPGLLHIAAEGGQRFRVLHSEKLPHGLWMADIETLSADAPAPVPPELAGIAHALHAQRQRMHTPALAARVATDGWPAFDTQPGSPWSDAGWVANRWAERLPLPLPIQHSLMALDSPLVRLELVGDALATFGVAG